MCPECSGAKVWMADLCVACRADADAVEAALRDVPPNIIGLDIESGTKLDAIALAFFGMQRRSGGETDENLRERIRSAIQSNWLRVR